MKYEDYSDADVEDAGSFRRQSTSTNSSSKRHAASYRVHEVGPDDSDTELSARPKPRKRSRTHRPAEKAVPVTSTKQLALGDGPGLQKYYKNCLKDLQQSGCKIIGKAWVKLLEPKKQSTYPYTGGSKTAPPWWPPTEGPDCIRHKEPDHLHKTGNTSTSCFNGRSLPELTLCQSV